MAARTTVINTGAITAFRFHTSPPFLLCSKLNPVKTPLSQFSSFTNSPLGIFSLKRITTLTNSIVAEGRRNNNITQVVEEISEERKVTLNSTPVWLTYLIIALICSLGVISLVYCRYSWQMQVGDTPVTEILGIFTIFIAAAVGMEFLSRWAHRVLWHGSLWDIHKSHHSAREGRFEFNDVFAIINAIPAVALINFGFFQKGLMPSLCFGAGLGMTVLGMAYIIVHNGLVHRRFPVGSLKNLPYLQKVAAAHHLHHSRKFRGVPYGLFLGPKELDEVGGMEELEKEINRMIKQMNSL